MSGYNQPESKKEKSIIIDNSTSKTRAKKGWAQSKAGQITAPQAVGAAKNRGESIPDEKWTSRFAKGAKNPI